jgi:hypothetical protein
MKLTIIPSDGSVYENEVCYSNLTWQGTPSNIHALQWVDNSGWIEFNDGTPNESITTLPVWANNAEAAWTVANTPAPPVPPTPEQIQAENKFKAEKLLLDSDWSQLPDVNLANKTEWTTYRVNLRSVATNPPTTPVIFPIKPLAVWA